MLRPVIYGVTWFRLVGSTLAALGILGWGMVWAGDPPGEWKAGTARVAITPEGPVWMAGYAARNRPAQGKQHELWVKGLAIESPHGKRVLLVTLDLCGVSRDLTEPLREEIAQTTGVGFDEVILACSHTHSGPVVGTNLITMYPLGEADRKAVEDYTRDLTRRIIQVSRQAVEALEPCQISWGIGEASFAVNRRENPERDVPTLRAQGQLKGPVDHAVPTLRVDRGSGGLAAVVMGYACHCTTLDGYEWSGDYAGFAQLELERRHPGTIALFFAGCGGDQNPLPRRSRALAEDYGRQLADAVDRTLQGPLTRLRPEDRLATAATTVRLDFAKVPDRAHWEELASSTNRFEAARARALLDRLNREGRLETSYPYPIAAWRLGGLTWVFLSGEVVVDYALRLKKERGSDSVWVAAYCQDVMAYIPSRRVLLEGGYEGVGAMVYYGLPSPWAETVEETIFQGIEQVWNRLDR